jgi:hypothetical protein
MDVKGLRREVERLGAPRPGRRFPEDLKQRLVAAVLELREEGLGWLVIGDALGITGETARRWHGGSRTFRESQMVPVEVEVEEDELDGLVIIAPSGYRIEGLTVHEAARLLRALR